MRRLVVSQDVHPISDFRAGVTSFLKQVHDTKRPVVITQHGKGVAVLMDVNEYENILERIELLEDIQVGEKQIEKGKAVEHEKAKALILKKIGK
ncbi:MAG: type II toxin-antitoxin system Phd/YefM family antitoxin [Thermodesulfovibrionia bacterium]|nr:type II toxin-antitoxin system Phd/YefM family antitoxin [Thermodesulfovibrionia bacterium]